MTKSGTMPDRRDRLADVQPRQRSVPGHERGGEAHMRAAENVRVQRVADHQHPRGFAGVAREGEVEDPAERLADEFGHDARLFDETMREMARLPRQPVLARRDEIGVSDADRARMRAERCREQGLPRLGPAVRADQQEASGPS